MRAYMLDWGSESRGGSLSLGYRFSLPGIKCHVCKQEWIQGDIEYPAFNFAFLNEDEFNDDKYLSVEEFARIRTRITETIGRSVYLSPGGSIGRPSGKAFKSKLDDFVWGRILIPQISLRARDLLASDGVNMMTAEMDVLYKGKPITSHLAIQVEPVTLLAEESLKKYNITPCTTCGDYATRRGMGPPWDFRLKRSAWPFGHDLVMLRENLNIVASEKFINSVRKHKLKGITFVDCGQFIQDL